MYEDGQLPEHEAVELVMLARTYMPEMVLEIGTYFGHTTWRLAQALPHSIIHTLDLPGVLPPQDTWPVEWSDWHLIARRDVGREFRGRAGGRIMQWYGDSKTWDWSLATGADFIFIDGSHTAEYCRNDTEKAYALMGGHGTIVWHDVDPAHMGVLQTVMAWDQTIGPVIEIPGTRLAYWSNLTRVKTE